jgi:hypothetical protein
MRFIPPIRAGIFVCMIVISAIGEAISIRVQNPSSVPLGFACPASQTTVLIKNKLTTKALSGVVTDSTGSARVPDVLVERVTKEGQRIDAAFSGGTGRFELKPVPDGDYILRFSLRGFDTVIVTVRFPKTPRRNFALISGSAPDSTIK